MGPRKHDRWRWREPGSVLVRSVPPVSGVSGPREEPRGMACANCVWSPGCDCRPGRCRLERDLGVRWLSQGIGTRRAWACRIPRRGGCPPSSEGADLVGWRLRPTALNRGRVAATWLEMDRDRRASASNTPLDQHPVARPRLLPFRGRSCTCATDSPLSSRVPRWRVCSCICETSVSPASAPVPVAAEEKPPK